MTDLLEALSGETVAVRVSKFPSSRDRVVLLRVTPVTVTFAGVGVGVGAGVGSSGLQPENTPANRANIAIVLEKVFLIIRLFWEIHRIHLLRYGIIRIIHIILRRSGLWKDSE